MSEGFYHWPRFWYSSGEPIGSDEGFLYDPTSEFAKYFNPHVHPFSEISQTPCLALLGEPGIGRTRAVEEEVEALEKKGEHVALFPLGRFGSEERLIKKVFESQRFREWTASDHVLHPYVAPCAPAREIGFGIAAPARAIDAHQGLRRSDDGHLGLSPRLAAAATKK